MLLLDAQATLIPATVIVHLLPAFRQRLKVGSLFTLGGLEMARCHQNYRLSDSALMIRFSDSTKFSALAEPVCPIPEEHFKFCENNSLHGLANNNTKLPVSFSPQGKERVMATIKLDKTFHHLRGVSRNTGNNPDPSWLRGYAKVEQLSISELNEFVITAEPQVHKEAPKNCLIFYLRVLQQHKHCWRTPYLVEMSVADDTDEGLLVASDGEMTDGDDDDGDELPGNISALSNVDIEGNECAETSSSGTTSSGPATKKPRLSNNFGCGQEGMTVLSEHGVSRLLLKWLSEF
ncbi:DUF223 domain-containing protein [Raphanus sativus]|nr:DUF223 domain-containing protein [Raphanus sativus]